MTAKYLTLQVTENANGTWRVRREGKGFGSINGGTMFEALGKFTWLRQYEFLDFAGLMLDVRFKDGQRTFYDERGAVLFMRPPKRTRTRTKRK